MRQTARQAAATEGGATGRGPATAPADPAVAAFFDVDNTLVQGASIYWLARGLAARGYLSTVDLLTFAAGQLRFRLSSTEHPGDISAARKAALAFVAGRRVADMQRLVEEIFDERLADRIWPGTRALAQRHLDRGERVWLVTAAPVEVGAVIAERLGLTGAVGTVAEVADGVYTGALAGPLMHGPAKAEAIRALATAEGLDLARCTAYSDSINDLPMLTTVGHAVAVNPDGALRRKAQQRGWQIRDFRASRRVARVLVPAALAAGATAGAVAATLALRRRYAAVAPPAPRVDRWPRPSPDRARRRLSRRRDRAGGRAAGAASAGWCRVPGR